MNTLTSARPSSVAAGRLAFGLHRFADEASTLLGALLNPRSVIREVEEMRELFDAAARIEPADPTRAAAMRRRASRIGLR